MTLLGAILKKAKSAESISERYPSPPPAARGSVAPRSRRVDKYAYVKARVDASAPRYRARARRALLLAARDYSALCADNVRLLTAIRLAQARGRVDNVWDKLPPGTTQYYDRRATFLERTRAANEQMYKRIVTTGPRTPTTASLNRDWAFHRREMVRRAQAPFVLFAPGPGQRADDAAFLPPPGVKRPRVHLALRTRGCAMLGELVVELFTDVCPDTCRLFVELLDGDQFGHGYVGTRFFRKVPGLFWSGGDVIHDNGFGCYVQSGRARPVGAQSYHFSHSVPGLLSMRVTKDDEMCGIFNITFKALPQFDLRNEVFGRVIRPCSTYDGMLSLDSALGERPVVQLAAARRREAAGWRHGATNTRIMRKPLFKY